MKWLHLMSCGFTELLGLVFALVEVASTARHTQDHGFGNWWKKGDLQKGLEDFEKAMFSYGKGLFDCFMNVKAIHGKVVLHFQENFLSNY